MYGDGSLVSRGLVSLEFADCTLSLSTSTTYSLMSGSRGSLASFFLIRVVTEQPFKGWGGGGVLSLGALWADPGVLGSSLAAAPCNLAALAAS